MPGTLVRHETRFHEEPTCLGKVVHGERHEDPRTFSGHEEGDAEYVHPAFREDVQGLEEASRAVLERNRDQIPGLDGKLGVPHDLKGADRVTYDEPDTTLGPRRIHGDRGDVDPFVGEPTQDLGQLPGSIRQPKGKLLNRQFDSLGPPKGARSKRLPRNGAL